jgi:hypothetical protein
MQDAIHEYEKEQNQKHHAIANKTTWTDKVSTKHHTNLSY